MMKICMLLRAAHTALLRMCKFVPRVLQYWCASIQLPRSRTRRCVPCLSIVPRARRFKRALTESVFHAIHLHYYTYVYICLNIFSYILPANHDYYRTPIISACLSHTPSPTTLQIFLFSLYEARLTSAYSSAYKTK